jgi:hypothetical protein
MLHRIGLVLTLLAVLLLASASPALAGGWAVVTLDSLPSSVRAGQSVSLGFSVRQHGQELVNTDWNGQPLKPVLRARKQASSRGRGGLVLVAAQTAQRQGDQQTLRVEARQAGPTGHFVAEVVFPSAGTWEWEISVPPYLIQGGQAGDAAVLAPLTVLPEGAAAALTPAARSSPSPLTLPWSGVLLLAGAALLALASRRDLIVRRRVDQPR